MSDSIFLEVPADVAVEDVIKELADLFVDDLVAVVKHLDQIYTDPEFTQQMYEYFSNKVNK